jgi:hypothetical protein
VDIKKINLRKSENSFGGLMLSLVLTLALFFGLFQWWAYNLSSSGQVMNSAYSNLNSSLQDSQTKLTDRSTEIENAFQNVTEPREGLFMTAINGLRGLRAVFGLFMDSLVIFKDTFSSFTQATTGLLPGWVIALSLLAIIILVVMLIIAIASGANNKI